MIPAIGNTLSRIDTSRIDPASQISSTSVTGGGNVTAGADFASAMAEAAQNAVQTVKAGEATSIQGINGQASTQAVVDAVMGAERTLQTAIALRDKVVSAYLELSRMAI